MNELNVLYIYINVKGEPSSEQDTFESIRFPTRTPPNIYGVGSTHSHTHTHVYGAIYVICMYECKKKKKKNSTCKK